MREHDAQRLAQAIRRDFAALDPTPPPIWDAAPPIKVIDCVLSLNRRYEQVVWPRVEAFLKTHPHILDCSALRTTIASCGTPAEFLKIMLNTNDERRAMTLAGVVDFAIDTQQQPQFAGSDEEHRLRKWAEWARPGDYLAVGVPGFGLAGFQYLRMLFGADTIKPDVHICRYVSNAIGRQVGDVEALYLVERAASIAKVSIAGIDAAIWTSATEH